MRMTVFTFNLYNPKDHSPSRYYWQVQYGGKQGRYRPSEPQEEDRGSEQVGDAQVQDRRTNCRAEADVWTKGQTA